MADPFKQPNTSGYQVPGYNNSGMGSSTPTQIGTNNINLYNFTQQYRQSNSTPTQNTNTQTPNPVKPGVPNSGYRIKPLNQSKPWLFSPGDWKIESNERGIITRRNLKTGQTIQEQDPKLVKGLMDSQRLEQESAAITAQENKAKQDAAARAEKARNSVGWAKHYYNATGFMARALNTTRTQALESGNNIYGALAMMGSDWAADQYRRNAQYIYESDKAVQDAYQFSDNTSQTGKFLLDAGSTIAGYALLPGGSGKINVGGKILSRVAPIGFSLIRDQAHRFVTDNNNETFAPNVQTTAQRNQAQQPQPEQPQTQAQNQFDINGFMSAMTPMMQAGYSSQQYGDNQQPSEPQFTYNTTSYYRS